MSKSIEAEIIAKAIESEFLWDRFISNPERLSLMVSESSNSNPGVIRNYLLLFAAEFLGDPSKVKEKGLEVEQVLTICGSKFKYPLAFARYNLDQKTIEFELLC